MLAVVGLCAGRPGSDAGTLGLVMTLLVVFLPLVLIWAAVTTLRSVRALRAEAARLQATVDAMRKAYLSNGQQGRHESHRSNVSWMKSRPRPSRPKPRWPSLPRAAMPALTVPSADRKAALAAPRRSPRLNSRAWRWAPRPRNCSAPLSVPDFIRALQFPENPDDKEGFRALRLALEDRNVAKLIRAAQDVLTLLQPGRHLYG